MSRRNCLKLKKKKKENLYEQQECGLWACFCIYIYLSRSRNRFDKNKFDGGGEECFTRGRGALKYCIFERKESKGLRHSFQCFFSKGLILCYVQNLEKVK